jgi:hypothetical protein
MSVANHAKHGLAQLQISNNNTAGGLRTQFAYPKTYCVLRSGRSDTVVEITNAVSLEGRLIGNLYI